MIRMMLAASIVHKDLEPIGHSTLLFGKSKADICKQLKLSGEHICNLKNYGQTSWIDKNKAIHTLLLKEAPIETQKPEATTTVKKVQRFLWSLLSPLKRLFQRLLPFKVPNPSLVRPLRPRRQQLLNQNRQ